MTKLNRIFALPVAVAMFAFIGLSPVSAQSIPMLSVTAYTQALTSVVRGANNVNLATVTLDARNSSEDIEIAELPWTLVLGNGAEASDLSDCRIYDSRNMNAALNTGSNVDALMVGANTITFDNTLVVREGTVVTLWAQCDVSASADLGATFQLNMFPISDIVAVSADSDQTLDFPETDTVGRGSVITVVAPGTVVVPVPVVPTTPTPTPTPTFPNTGAGGSATSTVVLGSALALIALGAAGVRKFAR